MLPLNMEKSKDISACADQGWASADAEVSDASVAFNGSISEKSGAHLQRSCSAMASPCCPAARGKHMSAPVPRCKSTALGPATCHIDDTLKSSLNALDTESTSQGWSVHAAKPAQSRVSSTASCKAPQKESRCQAVSFIPRASLCTSISPTYTRCDKEIR